jgi:hypothetical protein
LEQQERGDHGARWQHPWRPCSGAHVRVLQARRGASASAGRSEECLSIDVALGKAPFTRGEEDDVRRYAWSPRGILSSPWWVLSGARWAAIWAISGPIWTMGLKAKLQPTRHYHFR